VVYVFQAFSDGLHTGIIGKDIGEKHFSVIIIIKMTCENDAPVRDMKTK